MKTLKQLTVALGCLAFGTAYGASATWNGGAADGLWSSATNWSTNPSVPGVGDTVTFANTYGGGGSTINLNGNQSALRMLLSNTSANPLIFNNNTLSFPGSAVVGNTEAINISGSGDVTFNSNVQLNGAYTNSHFLFSSGSGAITFNGGLGLAITSSQYFFNLGTSATASLTQSSTSVISGTIGSAYLRLAGGNASQTFTLNGANTFTGGGGFQLITNGTLYLGNNDALGASTHSLTLGNGNVYNTTQTRSVLISGTQTIANSMVLQANEGFTSIGGANTSGTSTFSGTILVFAGKAAIDTANNAKFVAASGGRVDFSNTISTYTNTQLGAAGLVEVAGPGKVAFTKSTGNTYTGGTLVSAGTLLLTNTSVSGTGTGAVTVASGAVLEGPGRIAPTAGKNVTINGTLRGGEAGTPASFKLALTGASKLDFGTGSILDLTLGTTSGSVAFATAGDWLTGSGKLTLAITQGSGFSHFNTYTVFSNANTVGYTLLGITGYDTVNYTANFSLVGSDYKVSFTAIPEPSTGMLVLSTALIGVVISRSKFRTRTA